MNPPTQLHSPLADLERAFRLATCAPALLAVDGAEVASDLPERSVPLDELRQLLLHGQLSYATKDRSVGLVACRAQSGDGLWTVGLAGLLMPGLKRVTRRLRRAPGVEAAEVGPEVVIALLESISCLDPSGDRIAARLCWDVYRRAARALGVQRRAASERAWPTGQLPGCAVSSTNPEEVIARAVRAGALTVDDAELIARTRLESQRITDLAASLGLPAARLQKRRARAEARLTDMLRREAAGDMSEAHRSHSCVIPTTPGSCTSLSRYRSRPGGRMPGLTASPSDVYVWLQVGALAGGAPIEPKAA